MFCKNCGKQLDDGSKFCDACGAEQGSATPISSKESRIESRPEMIRKKASKGKGLKITFFSLLGFMVILFVILILVLGSSEAINNDDIIKGIIEQEPKVDMEAISKWDKGAFSINNIGASSQTNLSDYMSVWRLLGMKVHPTDDAYSKEFDPASGEAYIALDDEGQLHSITYFPDGVEASHKTVAYSFDNGMVMCEASEGAPEGSCIRLEIIKDRLVAATWLDDTLLTDYAIYEKTDKTYHELIDTTLKETSSPTPTETTQPVKDEFEFDVYQTPSFPPKSPLYTVLTKGVWTSVGIATNQNQMGGDDGKFALEDTQGCMYYLEFFDDQSYNLKYVEDEIQVEYDIYEIMDEHFCDGSPNENGIGKRFYYGAEGLLYMCLYYDAGDGAYPDVTDYIVFELKGDKVDWDEETTVKQNIQADNELLVNIDEYIDGTHWLSTGVELENPNAVAAATGYPRNYDFEHGELQYHIDEGQITMSMNDAASNQSIYMGDPEGVYIYAFDRIERIDDKERQLYSTFFIQGDYMYEVEMMDGEEVSNYIQFERYEP